MNRATTRILQLVSTSGYSLWKTLVVVNAFHEQTKYNVQLFFLCVFLFYHTVAYFIAVMLKCMLKLKIFSDCISFYNYQLFTQIVVAYVCFAVLSRRHLTQHRHLTSITSQLQTNFRIAPSFIYNRRCQLKNFFYQTSEYNSTTRIWKMQAKISNSFNFSMKDF